MSDTRIVNDRYEVGELIGRGGMADVHHATDLRLNREVAIKLLRRDLARDPVFEARFRREARSSAGLNHPAIVAVYDTGEEEFPDTGEGPLRVPFIVMEYVRGQTLRELLRAGEVDVPAACRYTLGVLEALQYSHRMGIVHRDIKPANVMVTADGAVKVMDFGIARALADTGATMTQTQAVVGTAQYLSPEQARGDTVDARSDLYSTGCLLHELLTGTPPFTGESPVSLAYQHVSEEPPAPSSANPEVGEALDAVVATALRKERERRFQDAASFAEALEAAAAGRALPAAGPATAALDPEATQAFGAVSPETRPVDRSQSVQAAAVGAAAGAAAAAGRDGHPLEEFDGGAPARASGGDGDYARRRRRAWATVLAVGAVLVLAVGAWLFVNWFQQEQARNALVDVPDVANMGLTEAQNTLLSADLVPITEYRFDDSVPRDTAIGTDPAASEQAPARSEVRLFVSQGPENVVLPEDLRGQSEATVRSALAELGLVVDPEVLRENSATVPFDRLIGTNPELGEQVKAGSTVQLSFSTGNVTVPNLLDLSVEEARETVEDEAVGLSLRVVQEENTVLEPGTITGQQPAAGADLEQGGTVTITVATAPAEPSPEPEPEPEPEETDNSGEGSGNDDGGGSGNGGGQREGGAAEPSGDPGNSDRAPGQGQGEGRP